MSSFAPPVVTLVVGIAVHQRCTIPGWTSLSALFFSVVAGAVLSFTRSWRCGVVLVPGSDFDGNETVRQVLMRTRNMFSP